MRIFKHLKKPESHKKSRAFFHIPIRRIGKVLAYLLGGIFLFLRSRDVKRFLKDEQREVREFKGKVAAQTGQLPWYKKVRHFFRGQDILDFLKGEKREVKELLTGQENFERYWHDSRQLFTDFFIPHGGNQYRPKALRPKSLVVYTLGALGVKVLVTGFLFFAYPSPARLIEITSANITRLMNEARADANVDPLASNSLLASAAMAKGEDMIVRQYFAHDTPDGKRPWQWIDRTQYDYVYAGENLAMGFITAESAHDALMKSPTHRKNILNPRYRDLGIAVVSGNMNGFPSQILVQFFGTQRSQIVTAVARADTVAPAPAPAPVPTSALPNPDLSSQPAPAPVPAPAPKPPVAQPAPAPAPAPTPTPPAPAPAPAPTPAPLPPAPPTTVASLTTTPEPASPELPASSQSPEEVLAEGSQNDTVLLVHFDQGVKKPVVESVIEYSNIFFLAFLIFLFISLVLNIFIKIRVQHADLIFQTIVVIALIASMALIKLNYVEQIAPQLLIL